MKKILLLSPPFGQVYGKIDFKSKHLGVPPIGLAGLASYLVQKGHQVRLIDLTYFDRGWPGLKKILDEERPDLVGLTCTTPQMSNAFLIANFIKQNFPSTLIVAGGPHVSALPKETLGECPAIDLVVYGEGEETMTEVAAGQPWKEIKGLAFRENEQIILTPPRPALTNLDDLPFPFYKQLPLEYYGHPLIGPSMGLISGRGCPFQCTFCASNVVHQRGYRARSIENMVAEIELLRDKYDFERFSFWDDTFTCRQERVLEFCQTLLKRKMKIKWSCSTRVDVVSKEMLKMMKQAGCAMLFVGFESGNDRILELSQKRITTEQARYFCQLAREAQIPVCGYFILGLPGETKKTILQTIQFAKDLKIDFAQFALLMPLPGTAVWQMAEQERGIKLLSKDWPAFSRYQKPVIELPDVSAEELYQYYKQAYQEFYCRPSYFWQRLSQLHSWADLKFLYSNTRLFLEFYGQ